MCVCVCVCVLGGWLSLKLICLVDNKTVLASHRTQAPRAGKNKAILRDEWGGVGGHVQPLIPVAPARAHKPFYHPPVLRDQGRRCLESSRQGWVKYSSLLFVLVAFLCLFLGFSWASLLPDSHRDSQHRLSQRKFLESISLPQPPAFFSFFGLGRGFSLSTPSLASV